MTQILFNIEKYFTARQATEDNMEHAHFNAVKPKATNTHSECVILKAFPQQKWLHECASILC
jgi:hypothetical protein